MLHVLNKAFSQIPAHGRWLLSGRRTAGRASVGQVFRSTGIE